MAQLFSAIVFVVFRRTLDPQRYAGGTSGMLDDDNVDDFMTRDREGVNTLWSHVESVGALISIEPRFVLRAHDALEHALVLFALRLVHLVKRVSLRVGSGRSLVEKVEDLIFADLIDAFSEQPGNVDKLMEGLAAYVDSSDNIIPVMSIFPNVLHKLTPDTRFLWM